MLALSLVTLLTDWQSLWFWLLVLTLFFAGFNLLEAKLPSTVSNLFGAQYRGTALGIFSTSQFLGAFLGGSVTGYLLPTLGFTGVVWLNIGLMIIAGLAIGWLGKLPEVKRWVLELDEADTAKTVQESALKLAGVIEAIADDHKGKVYLRVDDSTIEREELEKLGRIQA